MAYGYLFFYHQQLLAVEHGCCLNSFLCSWCHALLDLGPHGPVPDRWRTEDDLETAMSAMKARLDAMETHLDGYGIVPLHGSGTTNTKNWRFGWQTGGGLVGSGGRAVGQMFQGEGVWWFPNGDCAGD